MKYRGDLLNLNRKRYIYDRVLCCPLYSLKEVVDGVKFLAVCPILTPDRIKYSKAKKLTNKQLIEYLNGKKLETFI